MTATARPASPPPSPADVGRPVDDDRPGAAARLWSETWRWVVAAVVGLLLFVVVWFSDPAVSEGLGEPRFTLLVLLDLVLGSAALVLVPFRRHAPLVVALVAVALCGASALGIGAAVLATVSLATRRRPVEIGLVSVVFVGASVLGDRIVTQASAATPLWQLVAVSTLVVALLVAVGLYVGGRRELLRSLRERARLAEEEQSLRLAQARDHERTRIAREMHDVLAHRLSLVALHAGALEYREGLGEAETRATAGVIRDNARAALTELREVLGVLRDGARGGDGPDADPDGDPDSDVAAAASAAAVPPQPTLAGLDGLLHEARAAGAAVTLRVDDDTRRGLEALPTSTSRHAFRVVQECLTNARRHAPGQPVTVGLSGRPGRELRVRVENTTTSTTGGAEGVGGAADGLRVPERGHGLTGLEERARLAGGSLTVEHADGRFTVEARLPWTR
ncbi:two-component sensor histidine kinase [Frigoribacterium sp. NBH87]|uniref:sensor histidine kinase n=1 Tax=Frigoribacterium sp. NBH87 TaxID=2596916 RepID=UPI001627406F|nr:histidine kinase [Frigoribacterium sp. NBH87]QNE43411.1 two-component sensor histidine kinase [Frigoribacterium sp. NBH87]